MAAPSITVVDSANQSVVNWDAGVVQANNESSVKTVYIWNNRGGSTALSDLKDANLTALDEDGRAVTDIITGKWIRIQTPNMTEDDQYTPVGGNTAKTLRADGLSSSDGAVIRGTANSGTAADQDNFCTVNMKIKIPAGTSAGIRSYKMRVNGYFT